MKNKWLILLLPLIILIVFFLMDKEFAISLSQVSEMLKSGNSNSLQMFYYDGSYFDWLVSIVISIYGILVPIFPKAILFIANSSYFGVFLGYILVFIGMMLAMTYIYMIGRWIGTLIKSNLVKVKWVSVFIGFLSSLLIVIFPLSIIGLLISGLISKSYKLGLSAITTGVIFAGIIQTLI